MPVWEKRAYVNMTNDFFVDIVSKNRAVSLQYRPHVYLSM